jgi:predicted RecA/RadA family phage recombinase
VWGKSHIVDNVTALREVKSGHLHECPDGRIGYYGGAQTIASGAVIPSLQTEGVFKIAAGAFAAIAAGQRANFNMTTQALVISGQTNVGTYVKAKALNDAAGIVALNNSGQPVDVAAIPTTTAAPTTTTAGG